MIFHHMRLANLIETGRDYVKPLLDDICKNIVKEWEMGFGAKVRSLVGRGLLVPSRLFTFNRFARCVIPWRAVG